MVNLRNIKRKVRRDLHREISIPALYIPTPGHAGVPITVRIHSKWDAFGLQGAEAGLAQRREGKLKIVFMREQLAVHGLAPKRSGIVSVEPGEAYKLDNAEAPDDITITFWVTAMAAEDAADLPVPTDG